MQVVGWHSVFLLLFYIPSTGSPSGEWGEVKCCGQKHRLQVHLSFYPMPHHHCPVGACASIWGPDFQTISLKAVDFSRFSPIQVILLSAQGPTNVCLKVAEKRLKCNVEVWMKYRFGFFSSSYIHAFRCCRADVSQDH